MTEERIEARVGAALHDKGWTICTAESCTGGLVLHHLTNVPGSSAYVLGGIVAYSNHIKHALLHVREETLQTYGAVSEQTASEMAVSARAIFGADIAVSVTGIAGPTGDTPEKPVGLTYIGLAGPDGLLVIQRHVWNGDREANKASSAEAALQLVLDIVGK